MSGVMYTKFPYWGTIGPPGPIMTGIYTSEWKGFTGAPGW